MVMSFPSSSSSPSSSGDGGGGGGGRGGGSGHGGGHGGRGGGSGLIHQRCLGHHRHVKEGKVGSTKEDFVLSDPKREPEIYGEDYFAEDKLQDQIITTFPALNRHLVSEHAAAVEQPGLDYVIPVIGCTVLLFVCLLFQRG